MKITSDCPTNCKYISGDRCIATECDRKLFRERGEQLKQTPMTIASCTISLDDLYRNTDMYVSCLVCGESIKIPKGQAIGLVKICDKCKSAILAMRKQLEEEDADKG